mgnify:CR=1 FL=1
MTIYDLMKKLMRYPANAKVDYKIIIGTDNGCETLLYEEPLDKKEMRILEIMESEHVDRDVAEQIFIDEITEKYETDDIVEAEILFKIDEEQGDN